MPKGRHAIDSESALFGRRDHSLERCFQVQVSVARRGKNPSLKGRIQDVQERPLGVRLDWKPELGELQDRISVRLQDSRNFAEKRSVIGDMFHKRDGHDDADASVLERQMLSASLDCRDGWVYESTKIVSIGVQPNQMVIPAQENRYPTRSASEVDDKPPLVERRPCEIPDQGRVAIVPCIVKSERVKDLDDTEVASRDCTST